MIHVSYSFREDPERAYQACQKVLHSLADIRFHEPQGILASGGFLHRASVLQLLASCPCVSVLIRGSSVMSSPIPRHKKTLQETCWHWHVQMHMQAFCQFTSIISC